MAVQISGNDITVPRDGSFTRNVTIGGTLTYEDVTNIDSVGLVTARNGIVVGSGITLSKDGDGFFTGIVTATSYAGASAPNANQRGISVKGVGSNAAGFVDFLDSSGNVDGRIIADNGTITINADTAGATANSKIEFYVDGSEKLRIDSSGRLLLGHTAVGSKGAASPLQVQTADSGAFAVTIRNRSSNNDYGFIGFTDDDADEDLVQIGIQRTAANNGDLFFYTNGGASSSSERLRIKSDGKVGINDTNPLATLHIEGHNTTNGTVFLEPHSSKGNNISHIHHGSAGNWYIRPADASGYIYHDIGKSQFTNGILFGNDTADANTLDDYEEGTWTPVPGVGTVTLGNGGAKYTRIGRVVYCQFDINYTGSSSSSSGFSLPFNSASEYGSGSVGWTNRGYPLFVHVQSTAFAIMDNSSSNGSGSQHATYSELSGTRFIGDFRYFIA